MNDEEKNIQNVENSSDEIVNSIANSETREEKSEVKGQTQEKADFTSMFGVQSEETQEEKDLARSTVDIPRVLEVKDEDREQKIVISDEEKKANHQKNFNSDEKLVYQIEPEKTGNPLVVLFFFIALIIFILFLPQIGKKIDLESLFKTKTTNQQQEEEQEEVFYRIESSATSVKVDDLTFINFTKSFEHNEYKLSFTIQNNGDKMFQFDKKYYFVLYEEKDLEYPIYYALIHSYNGIAAKNALESEVIINKRVFDKGTRFQIVEIPETKYNNFETSESEGEFKILTCKYLNDNMRYYFKENKLVKIKETYEENQLNNEFYSANLNKFKNLSEKYRKIENFDTVFVEAEDRFTQVNNIYLDKISDNTIISLKTYRFFRYNTDKNTVAFEIQGQGYTCS